MRKKRILATILVTTLAVCATGCGKKKVDNSAYKNYPGLENIQIVSGDTPYSSCVTLGKYEKLELTKEIYSYDEEDVEQEAQLESTWKEYTDASETAVDGDTCNIDFKGTINGEEFENGSAENYQITIGAGQMIDGFEEAFISMHPGEEKDVELTFPSNYNTYGGQTASFHLKLNYIMRQDEITDEDKKEAEKTLQERNEITSTNEMKSKAWNLVLDSSTIKALPISLLEFYETYYDDNVTKAYESTDKYRETNDLTEEEYENEKGKYAVQNAKYTVVSGLLAEKFEITKDSEAYQKAWNTFLTGNNLTEEKANETYGEEFLEHTMILNAVLEELVAKADITENMAPEETTETGSAPESETMESTSK